MNKKEKLLNSLDGLEMSFKKKQEFVNILVGDSESDSNESTMEYLDVSILDLDVNEQKMLLKQLLVLFSCNTKIGVSIIPPCALVGEGLSLTDIIPYATQCAINFDMQMYYSSTYMTIKELLIMRGFTEILDAIPRITKEQFYNTNSDSN